MPYRLLFILLFCHSANAARPDYPWPQAKNAERSVASLPVPPGFKRVSLPPGSFGAWLRGLPLKAPMSPVKLHDGQLKNRQDVHAAVLALDTGRRDLQQCADLLIRLRGEYLYAREQDRLLSFRFTSGDAARFDDWARGLRPVVTANRVRWLPKAAADSSYASLRRYLDTVFMYAGSASLHRELKPASAAIEPGEVFIQGGFPGHAVIVLDVAEHPVSGERRFLLAQSYMPAQDAHILRNPLNSASPWYALPKAGALLTPEWRFDVADRRRFDGHE